MTEKLCNSVCTS